MIYHFVLFCALHFFGIQFSVANKTCDFNLCNYEGICTIESRGPSCQCVKNMYEGQYCDRPINLCSKDTCKNGGKCTSVPGGYICDCKRNFFGPKCDSKNRSSMQKVQLHYNHLISVYEEINFLVVCEELPEKQSFLKITSERYAIASFLFKPNSRSQFFKRSNDMKKVATKLKIKKSQLLSVKKGFYWSGRAKFTELGTVKISLKIEDSKSSETYFNHDYYIIIYLPPETCYPSIRYPACEFSSNPLKLVMNSWNFISPELKRSCGTESSLRFKWTIENYFDKNTLYEFSGPQDRNLKLPPYVLPLANKKDTFYLLYVIKLVVTESYKNQKGNSTFRCYVHSGKIPPSPVITGGYLREINYAKESVLDGSKSRDLMLSPHVPQNLSYLWECTANVSVPFCNKLAEKGVKLVIPRGTLALNISYNFTLQINASTTSIVRSIWQQVIPVPYDPLNVNIECMSNCENNIAHKYKPISFRAICSDCKLYPVDYTWAIFGGSTISNKTYSNKTRVNIEGKEFGFAPVLKVQLTAVEGLRSGISQVEVKINTPPRYGKCFVSSTKGEELKDIFEITCLNYKDDQEPIFYRYYHEDILLAETTSNSFKTTLTKIENSTSQIHVSICDTLNDCTYYSEKIFVTQTQTLPSSKDIINFLKPKNASQGLKYKILYENPIESVNMMMIAARELGNINENDERLEVVKVLLDHIASIEIKSFTEVNATTRLVNRFFEKVKIDSKTAVVLENFLKKFVYYLIKMHSRKLLQTVDRRDYVQIEKQLLKTVDKLFNDTQHFPKAQRKSPFPDESDVESNQEDWNFVSTIFDDLRRWQTAIYTSLDMLQTTGGISGELFEPNIKKTLRTPNAIRKSYILNPKEYDMKSINESVYGIVMLDETSLTKHVLSKNAEKFCVQTIFYKNNPFWWYPEENNIKASVISISLYPDYEQQLDYYFDIYFKYTEQNPKSDLFTGFVNGSKDMPVYQLITKKGFLILFKFYDIEENIRFQVSKYKRPVYNEVEANYTLIVSQEDEQILRYGPTDIGSGSIELYIGLILDDRNSSKVVNFSLEIREISCRIWNMSSFEWTSDHCYVDENTNSTHVHCKCNHLSVFSTKLFMTPSRLVLSKDIILAIEEGSCVALLFVVILMLIFTLLMIWGCCMDKIDKKKRQIIYIGSRSCCNKYLYLVTISTGTYPFAGTTAHVRIQLHGEKLSTEEYILYSNKVKVFQKGSEHVFAVTTCSSLGKIRKITLSHDSAGRYPSWYCDMIRVKDTVKYNEYLFVVRKWFSNIFADTVKRHVQLASKSQVTSYKFLLKEHFVRGFRDNYILYSLFFPHPRSTLSRTEKIITYTVGISFTAMLIIIYFGRSTIENAEEERETYSKVIITIRTILYTTLCAIAGMLLTYFISFLFASSVPKTKRKYKLVLNN